MVSEPKLIMPLSGFNPRCPSCGNAGNPVKTTTVHSLLLPDKRDHIKNLNYYFCNSAECDTVYFTGNGEQTFTKADMAVRVGVKEKASPRPVCYCFNHTVEEIDEEIKRTGKSSVIEDIKEHMKKEGCSCETKNPQGSCCLKTVENYVQEALARFGS
jgi:hypothetical protein